MLVGLAGRSDACPAHEPAKLLESDNRIRALAEKLRQVSEAKTKEAAVKKGIHLIAGMRMRCAAKLRCGHMVTPGGWTLVNPRLQTEGRVTFSEEELHYLIDHQQISKELMVRLEKALEPSSSKQGEGPAAKTPVETSEQVHEKLKPKLDLQGFQREVENLAFPPGI